MLLQDAHQKRTRKFTLRVFFKIRLMTHSHNFNIYNNGKSYTHNAAAA